MVNCSTKLPFLLIKLSLDDMCRCRLLHRRYLDLLRLIPLLLAIINIISLSTASKCLHKCQYIKNGWMFALICLPRHLKVSLKHNNSTWEINQQPTPLTPGIAKSMCIWEMSKKKLTTVKHKRFPNHSLTEFDLEVWGLFQVQRFLFH